MKSESNSKDSLFSRKTKPPKSISIREADGGYIVSDHDYMSPVQVKDKVYSDIEGIHACIDEKFGTSKKKSGD